MKKLKIAGIFILVLILLIAGLGFYKFNFTDDDIYFSGKNIQPESYKVFQGTWILENSKIEEGFTLNIDSSASSINMETLIYKKWKIEKDQLILTFVSLGNGVASITSEKYIIKYFNYKRIILEKDGVEYSYKKSKKIIKPNIINRSNFIPSFKYFPADNININENLIKKQPIDFTSNSRASKFKTAISKLYDTTSVNFASYYTVLVWGCGSGCNEGVMIDTRDGVVYNLPTRKGYFDFGNSIENHSNSVLLITSYTHSAYIPKSTNREVEITYWLWHESAKEFVKCMSSNKIVKE